MNSYVPQHGEKVITSLSGGLDAACTLAWAARRGLDQHAIYLNYGHDGYERELTCARIHAQHFNVPLELVDLSGFRNSMIGRYSAPLNMGKNLLGGLITALSFGLLSAGLGALSGRYTMLVGLHGTDLQVRPQLRKLAALWQESVDYFVGSLTDKKFHLVLPFADSERVDVIRSGLENGVQFENTWSCQASYEHPCGTCYSCRERADAFAKLGIADPQIQAGGVRVPNIVERRLA